MRRTINFDDESPLTAGEVSHLMTNWQLPDEFEVTETAPPQLRPQSLLAACIHAPQPSRTLKLLGRE